MDRILLCLSRLENQSVLADYLTLHYRVYPAGHNGSVVLSSEFDLCIIDGPMLRRASDEIVRRRRVEEPVFLPFLLLIPQARAGQMATAIEPYVDDVLSIPVQPEALLMRVRTLLRTRQLSLQLKQLLDQESLLKHELKVANEQLQHLASTDSLTHLANRRIFDNTLEQQWKLAQRMQSPIALILCDIDFFKPYNDHYGHLAGDYCLKVLAEVLSQSVRRPVDLVARYGGEEFVVLLPETSTDGALHVASLIQATLRKRAIPHQFSSVSTYLTLSMGVAGGVPSQAEAPRDLIDAADKALYRAKEAGRDRIVCQPNQVLEN